MSDRPTRIGFVGCGLIADYHARMLSSVADASIGPAFDVDPARSAAFVAGHGGTAAHSLDEVVAGSDAVYVCTWTAAHPEAVAAVAGAGKPVFCEKPLAVDLATAEAMTQAVAAAGVINQVGLVLRRSPSFRWLRAQLENPEHGRLMSVVFRDDQYLPTQGMYGSTWRGDAALAGSGTLLEHSIHDLDLLEWLMGPIATVSAHTASFHGLPGIDDQATVMLVGRNGAQAVLVSVWHDVLSRPSQRRVEVFTERAHLGLAGDWSGPVTWERNDDTGSLEGRPLTDEAAGLDGRGVNPDADFVAAVRSAQPAEPDFGTALRAHVLADAAYRSAEAGGEPIDVTPP